MSSCGSHQVERVLFADLRRDALDVLRRYDALSLRTTGRPWTTLEITLGLVGDIGDLTKLVMAREGSRTLHSDTNDQLIHELCDCIWSCLVLAERYDIDLSHEFPKQMADLSGHIARLGDAEPPHTQAGSGADGAD